MQYLSEKLSKIIFRQILFFFISALFSTLTIEKFYKFCRLLTEPSGLLTEPSGLLTEPSGLLTEPSVY